MRDAREARLSPGAVVVRDAGAGNGVAFRVWAPASARVDVIVYGPEAEAVHPLEAEADGWFHGVVRGIGAGARYRYRLDGGEAYPDPASRAQPDGVHAPSAVVDPSAFRWTDDGWRGVPLGDLSLYELHVGTATEAGDFDGLIGRLDDFAALGVTAVELMPVAEFRGARNWGYDGVYLFAPASAYGGPEALRRLVDAAHGRGLAVVLDVVYNHLGPEGNYFPAVTGGRYFTDRHCTPWGDAVDYASPAVREIVIQNAIHWAREYHVDGLRLDATHAILDDSPRHVLEEMQARVRAALPADRHFVFIAEDERNERRLVTPAPAGMGGMPSGRTTCITSCGGTSRATTKGTSRTTRAPSTTSYARCARAGSTRASSRRATAPRAALRRRGCPPPRSCTASRTTTRWGTAPWGIG